jgi:hypothetical protein
VVPVRNEEGRIEELTARVKLPRVWKRDGFFQSSRRRALILILSAVRLAACDSGSQEPSFDQKGLTTILTFLARNQRPATMTTALSKPPFARILRTELHESRGPVRALACWMWEPHSATP